MLAAGANANTRSKRTGDTPLDIAISFSTSKVTQILLDAGADVNASDEGGITPLLGAAMHGNPELIQILLDAGADVKARGPDGYTPLHAAVVVPSLAKPEIIQLLLDAGVVANAKTIDGYTAWDYAEKNELLIGTKAYWALQGAQDK